MSIWLRVRQDAERKTHQGRFASEALTARAGSGARTAELARRASATDGASKRMSIWLRVRQDAERKAHQGRSFLEPPLRVGIII
jgi:hypothetical protein